MIVYYNFINIIRLVGAVVQYGCIREGLLVWHWYVVDNIPSTYIWSVVIACY